MYHYLIFILLLSFISGCAQKKNPNMNAPPSSPKINIQEFPTSIYEPDRLIIRSTGSTSWGTWQKKWSDCPQNTIIVGFALKIEPSIGGGDDTSVNSVIAYCGNISERDVEKLTIIEGKSGSWGKVSSPAFCPESMAAYGYKIGFEPSQGGGDDTGLNALAINCKKVNEWRIPNNWIEIEGPFSKKETTPAYCPGKTFISGLLTKIEASQGNKDDTALNDIAFSCSNIKE